MNLSVSVKLKKAANPICKVDLLTSFYHITWRHDSWKCSPFITIYQSSSFHKLLTWSTNWKFHITFPKYNPRLRKHLKPTTFHYHHIASQPVSNGDHWPHWFRSTSSVYSGGILNSGRRENLKRFHVCMRLCICMCVCRWVCLTLGNSRAPVSSGFGPITVNFWTSHSPQSLAGHTGTILGATGDIMEHLRQAPTLLMHLTTGT